MTLTQFTRVAVWLRLTANLGATKQAFTHDPKSAGATDQGVPCDPGGGDKCIRRKKEKRDQKLHIFSGSLNFTSIQKEQLCEFCIFSDSTLKWHKSKKHLIALLCPQLDFQLCTFRHF